MKAILLVGGFGTRLLPLTLTRPKHMLPIGDRPMLEHIMVWLRSQKTQNHQGAPLIEKAVFAMGYQPRSITEAYPSDICGEVPFVCAVEPEPLGTAGALRFAASQAKISGTFLAMNGDIFSQISCADLIDQHIASGAEATLALTSVPDASRFGAIITSDEGRVQSFVEKPAEGRSTPSNWVNAGVYVMEPSVLSRIPEGRSVSLEREIFPQLVQENALFACRSEAAWLDVGTPESYWQAQFMPDAISSQISSPSDSKIHPSAQVSPTAEVARSMVMSHVRIDEGAVVEDSVLLPSSRVCPDAVVRASILGENAVVATGAVVEERSVIADDATVEAGARLRAARYPEAPD